MSCTCSNWCFFLIFVFQECTHYNFINESDRAITNSNRQFKCDITLTSGWYRFHGQAGQQMPTSCVEINHCGANAPGWINGTHPSVAEGVSTVQVCFNWGHKCCRYSTNIRVRNCSGFYVYELKKTPGCRLRYCGNGTQGTVKNHKTIKTRLLTPVMWNIKYSTCFGCVRGKKTESPTGFEPMTSQISVGCSNHWATDRLWVSKAIY